jgi:hypothetical protein
MNLLRVLRRLFPSSPQRTRAQRRQPRRWQPQLEQLESREVLSVTAHYAGNQLVVDGDSGGNSIRVDVVGSGEFASQRISYHLFANYWLEVGEYAGFDSLLINSGAGSDVVNLNAVLYPTVPITINGVGGNDVVNLNSLPRQAAVNVQNPLGYTDLNVTDPVGSLASSTSVGARSLTLSHPGFDNTYAVNYVPGDVSQLNINLGNAGNNVGVYGTPNFATTIHTGTGTNFDSLTHTNGSLTLDTHGQDTVRLDNNNNGASFPSPVAVNANPSSTTDVTLYDFYDQQHSHTYTLTATSFTRTGFAFTYANLHSLFADLAYTNDVIDVVGSAAGTNVTVLGTAAFNLKDQFVVNAAANALLGPVTLLGVAKYSSDSLVYNDFNTATPQTYTLTGNTLSRSGLAPVTYSNLQQVDLYPAGVGGNTINVASVAAGVFATVAASDGDTVTLGSNHSLAAIQGPVRVLPDYGNMTATVVLDDSGDTTAPAGPITLSNDPANGYAISGLAPAAIYLGAVQNTTLTTSLLAGAGDKTFDVLDAPQGVSLTVDGGSGTNTLVGLNPAGNLWNISGPNSGTVAVGHDSSDPPLTFLDIQNLTGTAADADAEQFWIYTGGSVAGNLQAPTNAGDLGYLGSPYYTGSVVVDLQTGFATGVGGAVSGINTVYGSPGANEPGLYNLLIGNGGCYLYGGVGRRNILVTGGAAANLYGGGASDEDLLIAGSTVYDTEAGLTSWLQIADYWAGADDRATRSANLLAGAGVPLLDATTVLGNGGGNYLIGSGSWALIFSDGLDSVSGFDPTSPVVPITP